MFKAVLLSPTTQTGKAWTTSCLRSTRNTGACDWDTESTVEYSWTREAVQVTKRISSTCKDRILISNQVWTVFQPLQQVQEQIAESINQETPCPSKIILLYKRSLHMSKIFHSTNSFKELEPVVRTQTSLTTCSIEWTTSNHQRFRRKDNR